ncbi:MAG: PLP-dependent aminotransferase family protein [Candidatus Eisenbacteria bacterium]
MNLDLERGSPTPLHLQIARGLRERILRGAIPAGARLPASRKMAEALGVNRSTVVQAYQTLWSEGLTEGFVGRGTVVRPSVAAAGAPVPSPPWGALFAAGREQADGEVRDLVRLLAREDVISLAAGLPAPDLFPMDELADIARAVLEGGGRSLLYWCDTLGYEPLRKALADRFTNTAPGEVMILSGSSQGIFLVARALIEPGDTVAVGSPTYLGAIQAFRGAGARLAAVPVNHGGMDLDILESVLSRTPPKFIYTVPTFQNPTGSTMPLESRRRLLDLAYRYGVPIVEDDPYTPLRYEGNPVPTLKELDTQGFVIHLSSFSKILFPGLRVGWMAAPKRVIDAITPAKYLQDLFTNSHAQAVVYEFCRRGLLDRHLEKVRREYGRRRDRMANSLGRHCPRFEFTIPEGGYFLWCRLPRGIGARELLRESLRKKVSFITGEIFCPDGQGRDRIRLNFASHGLETIEEGVRRLGAASRSIQKRGVRKPAPSEEAPASPIV